MPLASFLEEFLFLFLGSRSALLLGLPDSSSKSASRFASMVICLCSRGVRTLPPPLGKRGSSSLRTAIAVADDGVFSIAFELFLFPLLVIFSFSAFTFLEGLDSVVVFASFAEELADGAPLRLSELMIP